jgi:hypothetical protein
MIVVGAVGYTARLLLQELTSRVLAIAALPDGGLAATDAKRRPGFQSAAPWRKNQRLISKL